MKKIRGFSLVELMGVLALMGFMVVIAIALMNSNTVSSSGFFTIINTFLADVNQVKSLAASENRYYAIVFDANGTSYDIRRQRDISVFTAANFDTVRTVAPLEGKGVVEDQYRGVFFHNAGGVNDVHSFSVNSRGEIHVFPPVVGNMPAEMRQAFWVSKGQRGTGEVMRRSRITIYPFGGYRVEKEVP